MQTMSTDIQGGSAQIYEFPVGGRARLHGSKREEAKRTALQASLVACDAAFGSGWYHDAAIHDADKTGKH